MKQFFLFFLLIVGFTALAQKNNYYLTDSVVNSGVKIYDAGERANARFLHLIQKDGIKKYSPEVIVEYGINKKIYLSKSIPDGDTLKKVFLQRLAEGKINAYYYRNKEGRTFFIEKENVLTKLPRKRKAFIEQLANYAAGCPEVAKIAPLVTYRKPGLALYFERYNHCLRRPFPAVKFGITNGIDLVKPLVRNVATEYFNELNYNYQNNYFFGIFTDIPIAVSNISLHAEILYATRALSSHKQLSGQELDFIANLKTLKLPLMFRYSLPVKNIRPFINAGGVLERNLENENRLFLFDYPDENQVLISEPIETSIISNLLYGYAAGGGFEFQLSYRHSVSVEARYYYLLDEKTKILNISNLQFHAGLNF